MKAPALALRSALLSTLVERHCEIRKGPGIAVGHFYICGIDFRKCSQAAQGKAARSRHGVAVSR